MAKIIDRFLHPGHALAGLVRKNWRFFPNSARYLELIYFLEMGHRLNLMNPKRFTEKIQWLKLNDYKPEYTRMVDKITAKEYVARIIGDQHLIPTLGIWNHFDEIDFSRLPDKFVLKTSHGSGSNGVVLCTDKQIFNYEEARKRLEAGLRGNTYNKYRELPYKNIEPRIFAEQLLESPSSEADMTDYKFFCFNGKVKLCQVIKDRNSQETIDFYDTDWNHQDFIGLNPKANHSAIPIPKPQGFATMVQLATLLCTNHVFLRVDMYDVNGKVYFGELTFYPASGFGKFRPRRYDKLLGEMMKLPINKTE